MEFWSDDRRFGLKLSERQYNRILRFCVTSGDIETGGILIGFYTLGHNCAVVTTVTGPPVDSRHAKTWFHRGTKDVQNLLQDVWNRGRRYYLGEWHFHPGGNPDPSMTDVNQLKQIADSPHYQCPEPVLLIVGRTRSDKWNTMSYVFPRGKEFIRMAPITPSRVSRLKQHSKEK